MRLARVWTVALVCTTLLLAAGPRARAQDARRLTVQAQVHAGTYFVGQAIEVWVSAVAGSEVPEAVPPRVADAEVTPLDPEPQVRQLSSSGIGDMVRERNIYTFRYRVVAHRAGTLVVPPVTVRAGEQAGSSAPLRIRIRPLPAQGRPASFLGGVGRLQVEAVAEPTTLRAGQSLEYQIRLFGPAARGSTREPDVEPIRRLPVAPEVETLPEEAVADPPARVFHYRIRPTRPGDVTLPPVPVSFFDPKAERYLTRVTEGIPVRVVSVPAYDPGSLSYGPAPGGRSALERAWQSPWGPVAAGVAGLLLLWPLGLVASAVVERLRLRARSDPARFARRAARGLEAAHGLGPEALAQRISESLATYLRRATARPEGSITPLEARDELEAYTGDTGLAARAEGLVAACDRARFGGRDADALGGRLAAEARGLFEELGRRPARTVAELRQEGEAKSHGRHSPPLRESAQHVPPHISHQVKSGQR